MTSGFRRDVDLRSSEIESGIPLPTFRDKLSVRSSRVKKSKYTASSDVSKERRSKKNVTVLQRPEAVIAEDHLER
jgi:hypothetical protein